MHVDSDDIQIDSTNQYAVCVEKVKENDSKQKIHQTKKVPMSCFGDFNNMSRAMLVKNLKLFQLNTNGSRNVLRKRLEMYNNKASITEIKMFDYYVVIDYEATCDANQKNFDNNNQEIIEFPAVLLNCHTGEVEAEFQSYCRPVINPLLTKYCIELTGITQKVVDKSPLFHEVLASFDNWLQNKKLGSDYSFAIVTDGSKDIGHFLKRQSVLSQMDFPEYCKYWINIRKTFANFYQTNDLQYLARLANETVLSTMIEEIGYKFQGKAHSGLDDARNITFVAQRLLQDGASLIFNEKLFDENTRKKENCKTSFSTPVSKAEFLNIRGTFKPNFPTKSLVISKTPDRETVTRTVGKDVLVKACHRETKAQTLVKGVVKMPPVESNSANGASTKTKAKKSLHPTKDIVKISTKQNQAKHPSKGSVDKTVIQMEIKNMSTEDSLMKTSSEEITTSTFFSPTQASVKRPPGKSIAKIPETSAQNCKTAYDIKQELMLAKKKMYCTSELIPSKKRTQLKEHLEDLKKLLKAARSREEQSVLATKLDLSEKKEFKVTETTSGSKSNNCQLVMKRSSKVKVGKKLKSELNHLEAVINTKSNLPFNSTRGISVLDGNRNIGNFVASIAEEERLFFVDFENVLTMNSGYP